VDLVSNPIMSKKLWALWASELYTEKPAESVKDKLWALWSVNLNGQPQESIVETTTVLEPALDAEVEVAEMAEVLDLAVRLDPSQNHLVSHQGLATVGKLELPALVNSIISGQSENITANGMYETTATAWSFTTSHPNLFVPIAVESTVSIRPMLEAGQYLPSIVDPNGGSAGHALTALTTEWSNQMTESSLPSEDATDMSDDFWLHESDDINLTSSYFSELLTVVPNGAVTQPEASTDPVRAAETSTYAMNMWRSLLSLNFLQILVLVVTCVGE
jgi:hypothetical protein